MKINLLDALKNEFNFTRFRDGQREIIESIINGDEVVAILPTGGGKSLLPASGADCRKALYCYISNDFADERSS